MAKKTKTINIQLTKTELIHIRDLMSIMLPPDGKQTISKSLAGVEDRTIVEGTLWNKIYEKCLDNDIPTGAQSPDFFVGLEYGEPKMMVLPIQLDNEVEYENDEDEESDNIDDEEEEDENDKEEIEDLPPPKKSKKNKKK